MNFILALIYLGIVFSGLFLMALSMMGSRHPTDDIDYHRGF